MTTNKQTPQTKKKIHVCREALILTLTLTSCKGGRNVQLFSGCLYVWYPIAGCPPLPSQLEEGTQFQWAVLPSGAGAQPHAHHPGPQLWNKQLWPAAVTALNSPALQCWVEAASFSATACRSMSLCECESWERLAAFLPFSFVERLFSHWD